MISYARRNHAAPGYMFYDLPAYRFYRTEDPDYTTLRDDFEWEVPDTFNIAWYTCDRWATDDDRTAIYQDAPNVSRETYTYGELQTATDALATYLHDNGITAGDRVGVNTPQRAETLLAHLACWKLGAVSIPLSTLFGPDALAYRLENADAAAAIVDETNLEDFHEIRDDVASLHTVLTVGDIAQPTDDVNLWDAINHTTPDVEIAETDADDDAIILYTSGTTGDPKGVRHGHRVLLGHLPLYVTAFANNDIRDDDVLWTPAEWAWIASLFATVVPTLYYGNSVVAYNGDQFDPDTGFDIIDRYEVTQFFAPPTALRMMSQVDPSGYSVDSVRCIGSGGESVSQSIVEWAEATFDGAPIHEGYGQTEANALIGDCTVLMPFKDGTMGKPAIGHEVAIVDPDTAIPLTEPDTVGEIAVRYEGNPVCFKEYLDQPDKTAAKVQNGWLLTEDLGRMDEDGYIAFEGRKDDVIISAGYRIGPAEIEDSLASHDAVVNAGVIGVPDKERGEVPKAFVILSDGVDGDETVRDTLRTHVRNRLAQYEYPREITFVDELPTTTTGKIQRGRLRDRDA